MSTLLEWLRERFPALSLSAEVPLRDYTSFRIGGPAEVMAVPASLDELCELYAFACAREVRVLVMGNGSNLLVSDVGLRGLVVHTAHLQGVSVQDNTLSAQCGAKLSKAAMTAYHASLGGLAFAHGIPGTVGGAVFMNAGAYGGEIKQVVATTEYLRPDGSRHTLTGEAHRFDYRHSYFIEHPDCVILKTTMVLTPCDKTDIKCQMDDFASRRRDKQPLAQPSAGSVFRRPSGHFAGQLIEEAGLKGYRVGGAQVSEKHAGFIVNAGGATCDDVLQLIAVIQKTVHARSGVMLEPELRVMRDL